MADVNEKVGDVRLPEVGSQICLWLLKSIAGPFALHAGRGTARYIVRRNPSAGSLLMRVNHEMAGYSKTTRI